MWVSPSNAVSIAMGLHELATNAVKYGSLTSETGLVRVAWVVAMDAGFPRVRLTWTRAAARRSFRPCAAASARG